MSNKESAKIDVAPPYRAVALHGVSPTPNHDEAARFDFLANFNQQLFAARKQLHGRKKTYNYFWHFY